MDIEAKAGSVRKEAGPATKILTPEMDRYSSIRNCHALTSESASDGGSQGLLDDSAAQNPLVVQQAYHFRRLKGW